MRKKRFICLIMSIFILSCSLSATANDVQGNTTSLQARKQAFINEYSSLNIVEVSDLDPDDPDFWFILDDNRPFTMGYGNNHTDTYFVPNAQKQGNISAQQARTTVNTKYKVYNKNNALKYNTTYTNLFEAVNSATNLNDYVKEVDTGDVVFKHDNNSSTYYRFQYTNYYGVDWAVAYTPQEWVNAFRYAHVIDGKGDIIANSYYLIGGIAPAIEALEPESGSYYYKFSNYWSSKSSSETIDFSGVKYRISQSDNNIYIYTAAQSTTQTIELGIMSCQESKGGWWSYYRDSTSNWKMKVFKNKVLTPKTTPTSGSNLSNFVYEMNNVTLDLKLSLTNVDGKLSGYIGNTQYNLYGNSFSVNSGCTFLQAISLPKALPEDGSTTMDLRCNSYIKNIKLKNCVLNSNINHSGSSYSFYPDNSSIINTAFIYCDDTIDYTRSGNTEIVNIDYSLGYMQ